MKAILIAAVLAAGLAGCATNDLSWASVNSGINEVPAVATAAANAITAVANAVGDAKQSVVTAAHR